jgi:hypothetical protein
MGSTLIYLPDGQSVFAPEDPHWWSEGERVTGAKLTHDVGQTGQWYAARAMFMGFGTTATSMPNARAMMGLQTELIDNYAGHSTTVNNTRYVFPATQNGAYPADDYYLCIGYIPFGSTSASANFAAQIQRDDGVLRSGMTAPSGTGHNVDCLVVDIMPATGSSGSPYVELSGYQTTATTISTVTANKSPSLTVRWIGCARTYGSSTPTPAPHTWIPQDEATGSATGPSAVSPGVKVPLNTEIAQNLQFYSSPPIARLTSTNSTQTIPTGTSWTAVKFPTADIDNFTGWSSGSNTRYTCQRAGLYLVSGCVSWDESSGTHNGYRACRLQVNGDATKIYGGNTMLPTTGTGTDQLAINASALIQLSVGDYVELQMQQTQTNTPTALTIDSDPQTPSSLIAVWQSL